MVGQRKQLIISGVCALLACLLVFAYTASIKSEAATARASALRHYGGEQVEVLVATKDIPVGQAISPDCVQAQEWLVDLLPAGEVAQNEDQIANKVAQAAIKQNEPIVLERVGDGSSRISVPQGLEAVSVASDDVLAVGGAIQAGSFVDVYVETSKGTVVLLGERILVLETSAAEDASQKAITWVTLAVTPESVSELISASTKGAVHLVLPGTSAAEGVSK